MCMNELQKDFITAAVLYSGFFICQPEKMGNGMAYRACNISDEVMLFNYNDAY